MICECEFPSFSSGFWIEFLGARVVVAGGWGVVTPLCNYLSAIKPNK